MTRWLAFLFVLAQLDMEEMMAVHRAVRECGLLQQPPGEILRFVRELAR